MQPPSSSAVRIRILTYSDTYSDSTALECASLHYFFSFPSFYYFLVETDLKYVKCPFQPHQNIAKVMFFLFFFQNFPRVGKNN